MKKKRICLSCKIFSWRRELFFSLFLSLFLFLPFILKSACVSFKNTPSGGFPCGPVVSKLPDHAGDSFDAWSENAPHATVGLSLLAAATQAAWGSCWPLCVPEPTLCSRRRQRSEQPARRTCGQPLLTRLEKARAQQRRLSAVRKITSLRCAYGKRDTQRAIMQARPSKQTTKESGPSPLQRRKNSNTKHRLNQSHCNVCIVI